MVGAAIGGFWTAIGLGLWSQAGWILAGSGIFLLANIALLAVLHRAVARRVLQDQGEALGRFRAGAYLRFLWALPLTLFVHLGATLSAAMVRRVDWRGVSYQLVPPRGIRLHQYRRYLQMDGTSPQAARLSL